MAFPHLSVPYDPAVLRRLSLAFLVASLLVVSLASAGTASAATASLSWIEDDDGKPALDWSLEGSSDQINVLPNLRCELGPEGSWPQFPASDPCVWLVDHLAPLPDGFVPGCIPSREPGVGGPAPYASWRCDMRVFRELVIHAAQTANDRSVVMFNTTANGGSGVCATIPITVKLGSGTGELQARDGCVQRIECSAYRGIVQSDPADVLVGCPTTPPSGGSGGGTGGGSSGPGTGGGGSKAPAGSGSGLPPAPGSASSSAGDKAATGGKACPGASSGRKGASPLYSVLVRARGKRGMKVYVHLRRAVPITVDVRIKRGHGRTPKVVRWVSRCGKKGTNLITFPNATGGAKDRRNYRVYVKSPNSTYPLRSSWEVLPRR
jgi:hypothetical protein